MGGRSREECEAAPDLIARGGGAWRGGPSTAVHHGARYSGLVHAQFVAQEERFISEGYLCALGGYKVGFEELPRWMVRSATHLT